MIHIWIIVGAASSFCKSVCSYAIPFPLVFWFPQGNGAGGRLENCCTKLHHPASNWTSSYLMMMMMTIIMKHHTVRTHQMYVRTHCKNEKLSISFCDAKEGNRLFIFLENGKMILKAEIFDVENQTVYKYLVIQIALSFIKFLSEYFRMYFV